MRSSSRCVPIGRDAPVGDEHDPVGLVEHERARRHDDRRPSRAAVAELAGDPRLGVGVDGARRLDEDEDLRVREQRPREHEPLPLPARERAAALVDVVVEPVRQRVEDVLRVRDLDRLE